MAAAGTGKAEAYDPDLETYDMYRERLEHYFLANDISQERKKISIMMSVMGAKQYARLKSLVAPRKVMDLTLVEIDEAQRQHYNPKPPVMLERFQFWKRGQQVGESVASFFADLKKMAENCEFGAFREEALRDRFVCGLAEKGIQKRLLSEEELTLDKAVKTALGMEAATRNIEVLQSSTEKADDHASRQVNYATAGEPCFCCGKTGHRKKTCRFKDYECDLCKRKGHLKVMCRDKTKASSQTGRSKKWENMEKKGPRKDRPRKSKKKSRVGHVEGSSTSSDSEEEIFYVGIHSHTHKGKGSKVKPIMVELEIEKSPLKMEIDTGCGVSIVNQRFYEEELKEKNIELQKSDVKLRTFTGESIPVVGKCQVKVGYQGKEMVLPLMVVGCDGGPALFGRDWLERMPLKWEEIMRVEVKESTQEKIDKILKQSEVFDQGVGKIKGVQARLKVKEGAEPKFFKPRPVPFALKEKVGEEIRRLEGEGIIEPVEYSDWAAPVVPIKKPDGKIRLCGDYKVTVNPVLDVKEYPIPRPEELIASLNGGKKFSKLDLRNAYQQVEVEEGSREYLTINTQLGLYRYTRLPFGVSSAPAIFQECMDKILAGLSGVGCYLDDIIITGKDDEEHLENLQKVLDRLRQFGLRLKRSKCVFFADSVEYLGYHVNAEGIHPSKARVEAIKTASPPRNMSEVHSFVGIANYYRKFVPQLASILEPIDDLKKADDFQWTPECQQAFEEVSEILSSGALLVYFDPGKEITLAVDASPYGIGAVISHVTPDGDKPIAYASRKLNKAETNYSQLEKEALAIVYGVRTFHQYLCGKRFILLTDHKPLTYLFGPKKGIPVLAASRLQRWAILLSGYVYDIQYRTSKQNANADFLSRLPGSGEFGDQQDDFVVMWTNEGTEVNQVQLDSLPVDADRVKRATDTDPVLCKVRCWVQNGWPESHAISEEFRPWVKKRNELTVESGCLLWGIRVVIPEKLQKRILEELHCGHPGMVKMKSLARMHVFWPSMDQQIEQTVQCCASCQEVQALPPQAPVNPWTWPSNPWHRIHVDFAGPFLGQMFLIIVDAHSKWPEVIPMKSTTAECTIRVLRNLFSRYGLPHELVSDNGPQFVADEFKEFLMKNGVKHIRSAVKHPASNGEAERFVQTFKKGMKKAGSEAGDIRLKLSRFLLSYRNTPHVVTRETPAKLFLGRELRTRLSQVRPNLGLKLQQKQATQGSVRNLVVGERVMVLDFRVHAGKWSEGVVTRVLGPVTYQVEVDGSIWKRHINQIRAMNQCIPTQSTPQTDQQTLTDMLTREIMEQKSTQIDTPRNTPSKQSPKSPSASNKTKEKAQETSSVDIPLRRSQRQSKKPDRLDL